MFSSNAVSVLINSEIISLSTIEFPTQEPNSLALKMCLLICGLKREIDL